MHYRTLCSHCCNSSYTSDDYEIQLPEGKSIDNDSNSPYSFIILYFWNWKWTNPFNWINIGGAQMGIL